MLVISRLVTCGHFSQVCVEKLPSVSVEKLLSLCVTLLSLTKFHSCA